MKDKFMKNSKNHLTPLNTKGELIDLTSEDVPKFFENIARKRTQYLGLLLHNGQIDLPEALKAAYVQGMYDLQLSQTT